MSTKTDRQAIFRTDDESSGEEVDHEYTNPADSVKLKTDSRVQLTVQQKMEAVKHIHDNNGMTQAALIGWCFHKFQMKKGLEKGTVSSATTIQNCESFNFNLICDYNPKLLLQSKIAGLLLQSKIAGGRSKFCLDKQLCFKSVVLMILSCIS